MTEAADWKYAPNGGTMLLEPRLIDPPPNAYFDSAASASAPKVSVESPWEIGTFFPVMHLKHKFKSLKNLHAKY